MLIAVKAANKTKQKKTVYFKDMILGYVDFVPALLGEPK